MYSIGDKVVYGNHGVCLIEAVEDRVVDRKTVSYYVLKPLDHGQTQFFIPVHNQVALAKIRPLLTRQELLQILRSSELHADCWIAEENRRKLRYKELVGSGDFAAIAQMVHTLQQHKIRTLEVGRKFHLCDENFLRDGKKILDSEISVVLDIPVGQVPETLHSLIAE